MAYDPDRFDPANAKDTVPPVGSEEIWAAFLAEMIPVAEEAGVKPALHPEAPPLPELRGAARLVYHPDHFQRVYDLQPSPMNAIEFCVGTVSEMVGADVYRAVDRYSRAGRIAYVYLRNVRGKVPHYHETFVDDGDTDMLRVLAILHRNGYDGVIIPDHTPLLDCEAPWPAGMAYALGWMRAALTAVGAADAAGRVSERRMRNGGSAYAGKPSLRATSPWRPSSVRKLRSAGSGARKRALPRCQRSAPRR